MTGGSSGAAKPAITQPELADFLTIKGEVEDLKKRYAQERGRLLQLVEGDATVEPGRLRVEVRESAQQLVTKAFLISVAGEAGYEDMRAEAPPAAYRRLVVGERGGKSASTKGRGAKNRGWTVFVKKERP